VTFYDLFQLPLAMVPNRTAVTFEGQSADYLTLEARARSLAAGLKDLGVSRGKRVALLETNQPAWVELYLASSMLGAVLIGVNYRAKASEIVHMLSSSEAEILITGGRYQTLVESVRGDLDTVRAYVWLAGADRDDVIDYEALFDGDSPNLQPVADSETSLVLFTSGTTALPKTVEMSHGQLCSYIRQMADPPDLLAEPESTLLCAPLYHVAGFTSLLLGLFSGRRVVLIPQFEPEEWLDAVERERVTNAFLVPTMLKQILDSPSFVRRDLSSLRRLSYGAAPMPLPLIRRAIDLLPDVEFNNAYGQTETISTVTVLGPDDHRLDGPDDVRADKIRRLASVGRPLPGIGIEIIGDGGTTLPRGEVGEVCIRAGDRMKDAASDRHWIPTGDLGYLDDGDYLFLTGRKSDLIIRGGENIAPREVEAALEQHAEIAEVAVVGIPDQQWGESVAAFVVRHEGSTLTAEEVIDFARERLASYKKPSMVVFVKSLPLTATGKIARRVLHDEATKMVPAG
jgi:acyl-CoA synthetase (AMP-forming)/AMP-acid ligase II